MPKEKLDPVLQIPEGADESDPRYDLHEDLMVLLGLKEMIEKDKKDGTIVEADLYLTGKLDLAIRKTEELKNTELPEEADELHLELHKLWLDITRLVRHKNIQMYNGEWVEGISPDAKVVIPERHFLQ